MPTIDSTTAFMDELAEKNVAQDENRTVKIRLHKDSTRDHIDLMWHNGARYKQSPTIRLKRGMTIVAPIKKARAWFGYFTLPADIEKEPDESNKRDLMQLYMIETARTKLAWGDYPRPRKMSEGTDPIGPHRFPDVEVNVTEWDGAEWGWLRLHKLYNVGIFDPMVFVDPKADEKAALLAEKKSLEEKNRSLEERLAGLEGKLAAVLSLMSKAQNAKG